MSFSGQDGEFDSPPSPPKIINKKLDYTVPWSRPNIYLFTGNPIVNSKGCIVMGHGAAKEVRDAYRGIDKKLAQCKDEYIKLYPITNDQIIGWIKVKYHWKYPANLDLIQKSFKKLDDIAKMHPKAVFHCNFPGIGCGKLDYDSVLSVLSSISDNILLYKA